MPRVSETLVLGLLQGPAELLPISSSAHVGLLPWALGWEHAGLPGAERKEVEVALHAGTAVVLAVSTRSLRWRFLAAASLTPALAGLAFERRIEERLGTPPTVALGLVLGAAAMVAADRTPARRRASTVSDGLVLGLAQATALIPGVSRSGATIAAARALGFGRADAVALSREVALPVLAGATALKAARLVQRRPSPEAVVPLAAGVGAAAASSWAALRFERPVPLGVFAAYRVALAAGIVALWRARRTAAG
jgi:undecaprenyl-diphosphatase